MSADIVRIGDPDSTETIVDAKNAIREFQDAIESLIEELEGTLSLSLSLSR